MLLNYSFDEGSLGKRRGKEEIMGGRGKEGRQKEIRVNSFLEAEEAEFLTLQS